MWETLKNILTAREPGCGYFGGAEGAIRFLLLSITIFVAITIYWVV